MLGVNKGNYIFSFLFFALLSVGANVQADSTMISGVSCSEVAGTTSASYMTYGVENPSFSDPGGLFKKKDLEVMCGSGIYSDVGSTITVRATVDAHGYKVSCRAFIYNNTGSQQASGSWVNSSSSGTRQQIELLSLSVNDYDGYYVNVQCKLPGRDRSSDNEARLRNILID